MLRFAEMGRASCLRRDAIEDVLVSKGNFSRGFPFKGLGTKGFRGGLACRVWRKLYIALLHSH